MWRDQLREAGYLKARRGQQFAGGIDSPDVVCPELERLHFEVKNTNALALRPAVEQATRDAGPNKLPVVAHKSNNMPWLCTMPATVFFALLRGDHEPGGSNPSADPSTLETSNKSLPRFITSDAAGETKGAA